MSILKSFARLTLSSPMSSIDDNAYGTQTPCVNEFTHFLFTNSRQLTLEQINTNNNLALPRTLQNANVTWHIITYQVSLYYTLTPIMPRDGQLSVALTHKESTNVRHEHVPGLMWRKMLIKIMYYIMLQYAIG